MSEQDTDQGKRQFLVAATTVAGGVAAGATAVPFVASMLPSERAKAAGAPFVRQADGSFSHPAVTYIIDDDGKLRARFLGVAFEPLNAVIYINALVNDPHYHPATAARSETPALSLWSRLKSYL